MQMRPRTWGLLLAGLALSAGVAMAAIATSTTSVLGTAIMRVPLLINAGGTGNGEWIDTSGISPISIHITGITTATVEVSGSNEPTRPADATHGVKLNATDITANTMFVTTTPLRWIKARVVAFTSGSISAYLEGHGR